MAISIIGVIFASKKMSVWLDKNIKYLVSFSAGVFLIISYNLINETIEHSDNILLAIGTIIAGIIITKLISKILPESHHHEGPHDCHHHKNHKIHANRVLFGDALHNISDGIILVPAYLINIETGVLLTLGIIIHEGIQEISEFFVLKDSGLSTKQALTKNILVSCTILIGIFISIFATQYHNLEIIIIGLAAGSFLYIFVVDLMPNIKRSIPLAIFGATIFILISYLSGSHGHRDEKETTYKIDLKEINSNIIVNKNSRKIIES